MLLRKNSLVIILVILSFFQLLYSNSVKSEIFYPRILSLDSRKDEIFKQFEFDVVESKKLLAANQNPTMMFYRYKTTSQDTLFSISARCNILIETIATLNHISSTTEDISNKEILLPIIFAS